jgi:predicted transcriptional regulator
MCYGFSKNKPHLRIECRYLPAGPSAIDEIANFAFWVGLMRAEPEGGVEFWKNQSFKVVKNNFLKAARSGLNTIFSWYGKNIPAKQLILEQLLPMARQGLKNSGVHSTDIDKYLSVIEKRVTNDITGSDWTIQNFRKLSKHYGEDIAEKELVRQMLNYQKENIPLYDWKEMIIKDYHIAEKNPTVNQLMSTNVFTVHENDSIELVKSILTWNDIHHLPVESLNGNLVGLITDGIIERIEEEQTESSCFAKDIMLTNVVTIHPHDTMKKAKLIFEESKLSGLPVTYKNKLIGMLTLTDLAKCFPDG